MIDRSGKKLSIRKQCDLLGVNRSRVYYKAVQTQQKDIAMMNFIDKEFTDHPFTGVERMVEVVHRKEKLVVNHKRIRRLMRKMGLMAIYPKPRTTQSIIEHAKFPCLIRKMDIVKPDQVWCSDITYIRMAHGFMYLVAIMDYFSRYVLSWSVSNSLESLFCLDALDEALEITQPKIFHSDQGRQYTSGAFISELKDRRIRISMSGSSRRQNRLGGWGVGRHQRASRPECSSGSGRIGEVGGCKPCPSTRFTTKAPSSCCWSLLRQR